MSVSSSRILLTDFCVLRPSFENAQTHAIEWLAAAHAVSEQTTRKDSSFNVDQFRDQMKKFIGRYGCGPEKIGKRGHELEDFCHFDWNKMKIFRVHEKAPGAGMEARNAFFEEKVNGVFEQFYADSKAAPDDIIHVTCTGYVSPSGAQKIVEQKGWNRSTTITHAYHMGCYASVPALRIASGLLSAGAVSGGKYGGKKTQTDIVHTELCSLHLNPSLHSPEQLVVQSLFADGYIKYSAVWDEGSNQFKGKNAYELLSAREEILPHSAEAMTWRCSDWGMKMTLSRDVPALIADALEGFLERMFEQAGLDFQKERATCAFAVHPGGPKIIDKVQELLSLQEAQVATSKSVLHDYGNISSATLPHVWERFLRDDMLVHKTLVVSLAFGPGLSVCGTVLKKLTH